MTSSRDGAGLPVALLVSVLLLIGVGAFGAAAGPDVVSSDLDARAAPDEVTVPGEEPSEGEATANETYLHEALGGDFAIEGDELVANDIDGLPADLVAHASIGFVLPRDGAFSCDNLGTTEGIVGEGNEVVDCAERDTAQGTVLIETLGPRHSSSGSNFGEVSVYHVHTGGYVTVVQVFVLGKPVEGSTTELERDVGDYLESLEEALIAAALDDRSRPTDA